MNHQHYTHTTGHSARRPLRAASLRRSSLRFEPSPRSPMRVHEAREVIAAYADGADFDYVISRLAPIGEKMAVLLA